LPFAAYADFPAAPIDVFQTKPRYLACPQTQPSQEQQNRMIPFSQLCASVARSQDPFHVPRL